MRVLPPEGRNVSARQRPHSPQRTATSDSSPQAPDRCNKHSRTAAAKLQITVDVRWARAPSSDTRQTAASTAASPPQPDAVHLRAAALPTCQFARTGLSGHAATAECQQPTYRCPRARTLAALPRRGSRPAACRTWAPRQAGCARRRSAASCPSLQSSRASGHAYCASAWAPRAQRVSSCAQVAQACPAQCGQRH